MSKEKWNEIFLKLIYMKTWNSYILCSWLLIFLIIEIVEFLNCYANKSFCFVVSSNIPRVLSSCWKLKLNQRILLFTFLTTSTQIYTTIHLMTFSLPLRLYTIQSRYNILKIHRIIYNISITHIHLLGWTTKWFQYRKISNF